MGLSFIQILLKHTQNYFFSNFYSNLFLSTKGCILIGMNLIAPDDAHQMLPVSKKPMYIKIDHVAQLQSNASVRSIVLYDSSHFRLREPKVTFYTLKILGLIIRSHSLIMVLSYVVQQRLSTQVYQTLFYGFDMLFPCNSRCYYRLVLQFQNNMRIGFRANSHQQI